MRYLLLLILVLASVCQAQPSVKNPCTTKDSQAIEKAVASYLDKNSGIPYSDVNITDKQCVNSYASAKVNPKKPVTDVATVFLHKTKNKWDVMTLGTDFDEKILSQLPKELRPY